MSRPADNPFASPGGGGAPLRPGGRLARAFRGSRPWLVLAASCAVVMGLPFSCGGGASMMVYGLSLLTPGARGSDDPMVPLQIITTAALFLAMGGGLTLGVVGMARQVASIGRLARDESPETMLRVVRGYRATWLGTGVALCATVAALLVILSANRP